MNLELAGKACLVVGASRGIGKAIAQALAREGGTIAAVARGADELNKTVAQLGEGHVAIAADVTTAEGASAAVDGCVKALGGIDVVVANVGKSFAREASAMDVALVASNETLRSRFEAFHLDHIAPFSWREKLFTAALSAGVLGLFAFGLLAEAA